jgi:2,3,4,5-tetrahydropyridine-2-carboxylate N-succinyltransferase
MTLQQRIDKLYETAPVGKEHLDVFEELKLGLNSGRVRAAEPDPSFQPTGWRVNVWVKKGILMGFRAGALQAMSVCQASSGAWPFFDKHTYPLKRLDVASGVRIVPGGSAIRDGCYVARGVTCMPPMYINAGSYVDEGTMVDSHALVGSCAQIGKRVHLSAAAQVGGVLEPIGALPVIIEDDVLVGGNCGIYEGTVVKRRAVLGAGTILTGSTPVYDLVRGRIYRRSGDTPLVIPEEAVVVPGSRPVSSGQGREWQLSLYTPVIVKYRDPKTDAAIQLEDLLR